MKMFSRFKGWICSLFSELGRFRLRSGKATVTGAVVLEHYVGTERPPPSTWKDCHPSTRRRFKAELTCSRGHGLTLKGHVVHFDGRVEPSVVCPHLGCDFHEFVRLKGWTAGTLGP